MLPTFRSLFIFYSMLILLFSVDADAKCLPTSLRHIEFGKEIVRNETVCFSDADSALIQSKNCSEGDCLALKKVGRILPIKYSKLINVQGTPRAKLCALAGGIFILTDYQLSTESTWTSTDLCQFSDDSFVSGSTLMDLNRKSLGTN